MAVDQGINNTEFVAQPAAKELVYKHQAYSMRNRDILDKLNKLNNYIVSAL